MSPGVPRIYYYTILYYIVKLRYYILYSKAILGKLYYLALHLKAGLAKCARGWELSDPCLLFSMEYPKTQDIFMIAVFSQILDQSKPTAISAIPSS